MLEFVGADLAGRTLVCSLEINAHLPQMFARFIIYRMGDRDPGQCMLAGKELKDNTNIAAYAVTPYRPARWQQAAVPKSTHI